MACFRMDFDCTPISNITIFKDWISAWVVCSSDKWVSKVHSGVKRGNKVGHRWLQKEVTGVKKVAVIGGYKK